MMLKSSNDTILYFVFDFDFLLVQLNSFLFFLCSLPYIALWDISHSTVNHVEGCFSSDLQFETD